MKIPGLYALLATATDAAGRCLPPAVLDELVTSVGTLIQLELEALADSLEGQTWDDRRAYARLISRAVGAAAPARPELAIWTPGPV